MDLGTGDGAFALRAARAHPEELWIGIDSNAEAMADRSRRAAAKPARGGVPNALFVRANVAALPEELDATAAGVTVIHPWGSLLGAVLAPEPAALEGLRRICRPGASLEIVLALPLAREAASFARAGLAPITGEHVTGALVRAYAAAGFDVGARPAEPADLERFATTWSKRLRLDAERRFFVLQGIAR